VTYIRNHKDTETQRQGKLKLDESCISNPKSEISNWTEGHAEAVQFDISDFGFEMQDSSNFNFPAFESLCLCGS
jgi:hypothetical protein